MGTSRRPAGRLHTVAVDVRDRRRLRLSLGEQSLRPTKPHRLPDAVAALDLKLTDHETNALEEHYTPHGPSWS